METKTLTCIVCPLGCELTATLEGDTVTAVTGNTCPRGKQYAVTELTAPTRTLTTTVRLAGSDDLLPVKSATPLPKAALLPCMKALRQVTPQPPVAIGDVVLADILGYGVDIIATKNVQ
ncbi:MAG: DUF1667 domain-containing protein [Clostridia bacterium]|nr:DUF1667 domain-containing protein [Clostridia bacterium]